MSFMDKLGPEEQAQAAVVNYLRLQYPQVLFHHSPQETHTKSKFQRWKNKVLGTRPGCPDLLIFYSHIKSIKDKYSELELRVFMGLAIEMKHGRNKLTAEQSMFMEQLNDDGWFCEVCYSSAEAIEVIDNYLGKK